MSAFLDPDTMLRYLALMRGVGTKARASHDEPVPLSLRALLTAKEIADLDAALVAAYRMHDRLRAERPAARFIARPPIPAVLSESLVGYSAQWLFGDACVAAFGSTRADLIVRRPVGGPLCVEVKATGASAFQEVKPRDLASDVLVWVDFRNRYVDGRGPTDLYVLPEPGRFEPPTTRNGTVKRKFDTQAFLNAANPLSGFSTWRFQDIQVLATGVGPEALSSSEVGIASSRW